MPLLFQVLTCCHAIGGMSSVQLLSWWATVYRFCCHANVLSRNCHVCTRSNDRSSTFKQWMLTRGLSDLVHKSCICLFVCLMVYLCCSFQSIYPRKVGCQFQTNRTLKDMAGRNKWVWMNGLFYDPCITFLLHTSWILSSFLVFTLLPIQFSLSAPTIWKFSEFFSLHIYHSDFIAYSKSLFYLTPWCS